MTRYKGRHRKPTMTAKKIAGFTAAAAIPAVGITGLAAPAAAAAELPPDAIAQCESGGDNKAQNSKSTASGKWQFINGTWAAYGGTKYAPTAAQATEREQDIVAARAYAAEGTTPWVSSKGCWGGKSKASSSVAKETVKKAAPKKVVKKQEFKKPAWDGQTYKAPKKKAPVVTIKAPSVPGQFTPGGTGSYTVKTGDTLAALALSNGTTVDSLMVKNDRIIEHRNGLYVGEKLDLR